MTGGHDADLLEERTVLATYFEGSCLVVCRTDSEARHLVFRKFGMVNGSVRIYHLDDQDIHNIRCQSSVKTHRYDEE